jgi:phosphate transport system permease protein
VTARNLYRKGLNNAMLTLTGLCALLCVSALFAILAYLVYNGGKSVDLNFFTKLPLSPGELGGGMANAIVGSAEIVALAALFGIPIGFFTGIYLSEWGGGGFSFLVRYMCDLLNGVPSIVVGIFVWVMVVSPMKTYSAIAGGIALAIMLIPIVAKSTEQFVSDVPSALREGALALGATKWRAIATVVVPAARKGIMTGMILGMARIAGESAPLLFTSLNNQFWASSLKEPTASLPLMIYFRALSPYDDWHRQAWAAGLVLLSMVLVANIAARAILSRGGSPSKG